MAAMYAHDRHPSRSRQLVGELIRKARHARGLSQERLGEWSGLDQSVISRIETGRPIGLRFVTFLRVLDALGITGLQPTYDAWHPWSDAPDDGRVS
jgi:transcriptional regulator with XRE-family HTH domain